jgi:hypothetical protein
MSAKNSDNTMSQKKPALSASPERNTFQRDGYIERQLKEGRSLDDPDVKAMIDWYDSWSEESKKQEADLEWQKHNLEFDLRTTDWILAKVRESRVYAQNLYAALCNNDFQRQDIWPVLKNQKYACSWRHAGGIIADMQGEGDYIDWYCSGIKGEDVTEQSEWNMLTQEQQMFHRESQAHVSEGTVTDEIRDDLLQLGWAVVTDPDESY